MYGLKECSSCGALYNKSCGCSKGGFVDKFVRDSNKTPDSSQRPPHDCLKCGNPVDGLHCRQCALLRKKLKEVWFTICDEHEFFQDFLNTSESSNDNTNIVNTPQEPFVFNQDPGENSSQSPPHTDHHCCYGCGDPLDAQVSSFQTLPSFPQQYPCCEDCGGLPEVDHCQPPQYTVNHPIFNAHNDLLNSQNKRMEQMTSLCEMVGQFIQKKQEEKQIEEDQAANARYWKITACYDDDDDYNFAITPNEPADSLIMGDEHLDTVPATKSNKFIKSSVENLVSNPSESEGGNGCDVPACFTTFSNILFDADYDFYSVDDQSLSD
nr:hypothetical protein [Tanacetum cinerariifolium]